MVEKIGAVIFGLGIAWYAFSGIFEEGFSWYRLIVGIIGITELLDGTETRWRIREEGKQDCILFIWVKPKEIQRLFYAVFNGEEFKYKGVAFVWSQEGIIKEICVIGTRGKAELPKDIEARVIEAEAGEDERHPKLFDDMVSVIFEATENETP